jgi:cell division protein FtsI (penicillin-binding protein 3)
MLVKEIRDNGILVRRMRTEVLNPMIVTRETLGKAKKMLEGVCKTGTGRSLKNSWFKIAGKTGTAQIATGQSGYQKGMYLASFIGYFPADDPEYSLIVTINNPRGGVYYGGSIAGPVFKEISEKVFAARLLFDEVPEEEVPAENDDLPNIKKGKRENIIRIAEELGIDNLSGHPASSLVKAEKVNEKIVISDIEDTNGKVPDVRGMSASDAVFILENAGLRVKIKGVGRVTEQSQKPGTKIIRGSYVYVILG